MAPSGSSDAARVKQALNRALTDPLQVDERKAAIEFIRTELPAFQVSGRTTYLVLGSYRDGFERNLRIVQSELNKRTDTFAAVVGDLRDPDFADRSPFAVKLHLLATYADWIAGVYEKESGGESPELGAIHTLYFTKTHVLPKDYVWMTDGNVDTPDAVRRAALEIYFNNDLDDEDKKAELEGLYHTAKENDISITSEEIRETINERRQSNESPATYSWVHLSFFRDFERAGQCHSWFTDSELREQAARVPGPSLPRWAADWEPDGAL
ncbi:hypothetical protein EGH21_16970 [Halomicroarcula sp. F13]|uniref:Uncharacterized protein n=1 Tax=Haloarcula rubra TaxID=2487747 RepID=A0AAW4PW35_9EURY|nr:hypothetical protein [Halomicroarcula rubra]MBX0324720.1 hypothetical protein [Halomicroarcula rubra]